VSCSHERPVIFDVSCVKQFALLYVDVDLICVDYLEICFRNHGAVHLFGATCIKC